MNVRTNLASLLAFVVLALAGGWALHAAAATSADTLYHNNLASCQRGNQLRIESNLRIPAHRTEAHVVLSFLGSARRARLANYAETHQASDLAAARQYAHLRHRLSTHVNFDPLPIIDCERVIVKP